MKRCPPSSDVREKYVRMTEIAFHPITVTIAKTQVSLNAVEDTGERDLHGMLVGVHTGAAAWKAGFSRKLRMEMPYNQLTHFDI